MYKIPLLFVLLVKLAFAQESVTPWIGVAIGEHPDGVLVKQALEGTPAQKAGLKSGDIIMKIDDVKMKTPPQMIEYIRSKGVGHKVSLAIKTAAGKNETRTLKLVAKPDLIDLAKSNLLDKKAPNIELKFATSSDKSFDLSKQKKVTILEFWATWCGACAMAWPLINDFAKKNKNINVVAISADEKIKLRKYIKMGTEKGVLSEAIKILGDETKEITAKYFVPALPMFFVVDKKQVVRHIGIGTGEELEAVFKKAQALAK